MSKTRYATLYPLEGAYADSPKKGDLLTFPYKSSDRIKQVEQQLSDNVFLVISEENSSYIVYNRSKELLRLYSDGVRIGTNVTLALIGYTQNKILRGKPFKLCVWDYASNQRENVSTNVVTNVEKIITKLKSRVYKVTTPSCVFYVMR